jgi:hypothetical protein
VYLLAYGLPPFFCSLSASSARQARQVSGEGHLHPVQFIMLFPFPFFSKELKITGLNSLNNKLNLKDIE